MKLIELIFFGMYAAHRGSEKMIAPCSSFFYERNTRTLYIHLKSAAKVHISDEPSK